MRLDWGKQNQKNRVNNKTSCHEHVAAGKAFFKVIQLLKRKVLLMLCLFVKLEVCVNREINIKDTISFIELG